METTLKDWNDPVNNANQKKVREKYYPNVKERNCECKEPVPNPNISGDWCQRCGNPIIN